MNAGELELFSTQDLINELLRRTTFQGVIVHAALGAKNRHWVGEHLFAVHHKLTDKASTVGRIRADAEVRIADRAKIEKEKHMVTTITLITTQYITLQLNYIIKH